MYINQKMDDSSNSHDPMGGSFYRRHLYQTHFRFIFMLAFCTFANIILFASQILVRIKDKHRVRFNVSGFVNSQLSTSRYILHNDSSFISLPNFLY